MSRLFDNEKAPILDINKFDRIKIIYFNNFTSRVLKIKINEIYKKIYQLFLQEKNSQDLEELLSYILKILYERGELNRINTSDFIDKKNPLTIEESFLNDALITNPTFIYLINTFNEQVPPKGLYRLTFGKDSIHHSDGGPCPDSFDYLETHPLFKTAPLEKKYLCNNPNIDDCIDQRRIMYQIFVDKTKNIKLIDYLLDQFITQQEKKVQKFYTTRYGTIIKGVIENLNNENEKHRKGEVRMIGFKSDCNKKYKKAYMLTEVSVRQIAIDKNIVNAIKSLNPNFKAIGFSKDPEPSIGALYKLNTVLEAINAGILLEPIQVKFIGIRNDLPQYQIINGRHRFAIAVAKGVENIAVNIK